MKKILILPVIIAAFISVSQAQSLSLKNFQLYGEGEIFGENTGSTGAVKSSFLLGVSFDIADNVKAAVAMGYQSFWGSDGLQGKPISTDLAAGEQGYLSDIKIVNANLTLDKFFNVDGLNLKAGRQFYGDEDSNIMYFGVRHDGGMMNAPITSLDALTVNYDSNNVKTSILYGQMDSAPNSPVIMGGDAIVSDIAGIFDVEAYLYDAKNNAINTSGTNQDLIGINVQDYTLAGIKPSVKYENFTASVEFAESFAGSGMFKNGVSQIDSNMVKIDAAYEIKSINLTPRATYFAAGGDGKSFVTFGNFFPGFVGFGGPNTDFLTQNGLDNTATYNNVRLFNVGADYALSSFVFSLDYFRYDYRNRPAGVPSDTDSEIDLIITYNFTDSFRLYAGIGEYIDKDRDFASSADLRAGLAYKIQ